MNKQEAFRIFLMKQNITLKLSEHRFNFDIFFEGDFVSNQDDTTYEHVIEDLMKYFKNKHNHYETRWSCVLKNGGSPSLNVIRNINKFRMLIEELEDISSLKDEVIEWNIS